MSSPAPAYSPVSNAGVGFVEDWDRTMDTLDSSYGAPSPQHSILSAVPSPVKKYSNPASPLSFHPEIMSPGMEAYDAEQGKEVYHPPTSQGVQNVDKYPVYPQQDTKKRRKCLPILLVLLAFVVIAIGVGLGVGLSIGLKHKSHDSRNLDGNEIDSLYLSKSGAFNGSGIAIASQSFSGGGYGIINLYFQHWSGQIRKMQLMKDGSWVGGDESNIVATNARNGTPISAVAYAMNDVATWHIFYIDSDNIIREKINQNITNQWIDGPIGDLKLVAMNDSAVGLQACWYGSFYGTANYTHSPIPGTGSNTTSQDAVIGMHLWYGKDAQTLQEVNWTYNTTSWYLQDTFVANGHAGIACYSWGPGSVSYFMMINLDKEVQIAWKDLNTSVTATNDHPVNEWVNATFTIPDVQQDTSLGFTNYLYVQQASGRIAGYNVTFNAEQSKLGESFSLPHTPLKGTHFSVTAIPDESGGDSIYVFDQQNGTDITENIRDIASGQWTYSSLPVPDD